MSASSVIIDGNTIDTGVYGATSSGYDSAVILRGTGSTTGNEQEFNFQNNVITATNNLSLSCTVPNAKITNNVFRNVSASGRFISFNGAFVEIKGNKFYRGAAALPSYIQLNGVTPYITDNYFDSSTSNGTNESLITDSVNVAWDPKIGVMDRNVNQIYYKSLIVSKYDSSTVGYFNINAGEVGNLSALINNTAGGGNTINFNITFNLNDYFPTGTVINSATLNYSTTSIANVNTGQSTVFVMYLRVIGPIDSNFISIAGQVGSIIGEVSATNSYPSPTPYSQLTTAQTLTTIPSNNSWKTSSDRAVIVHISADTPLNATSSMNYKLVLLVKARYSPS